MNKEVERLFGIKLSKNGKLVINKWLSEEYGSIYLAKKNLDDDTSIIEFINDMLKQEKINIDDISDKNSFSKDLNRILKKSKRKYLYCPYCGEKLE